MSKNILNEIKTLLGMEVKPEKKAEAKPELKTEAKIEVKLEEHQIRTANGVILEAEALEPGAAIWIVPQSAEDERVPVPVGEYELEDGQFLVVAEEGIIASIGAAAEAAPEDKEQSMEVTAPKKVVETVSKETHFSAEQRDELKEIFKSFLTELEEAKKEVTAEVKAEAPVLEKVQTKKVELVVEPIKHSPEKNVAKAKHFKMGGGKAKGLKARVNEALFSDNGFFN